MTVILSSLKLNKVGIPIEVSTCQNIELTGRDTPIKFLSQLSPSYMIN
jgi:hypothetical protein